ncbi:hypothetical protein CORC01_11874 [Colletotrichum orchidophilum]|uniref:Uncharacterized protein n=1 Tax=Colletotrichum orchidophilum TaxID=1209926 RepID=A0A1G4AUM8_9PEZI|nr:uncharacterized protein CORC01_11874 [Colletotrichum orchidophilum]OHE92796.1 hypothetical protein CORC01_11874 [Colletotrichum orchidophilum]
MGSRRKSRSLAAAMDTVKESSGVVGGKIEPKGWKRQCTVCTSPCYLRCKGYNFSPPSAVSCQDTFQDPRGPSRDVDEAADDNFHAASRLEELEYGAKMMMDEST